MKRKAFLLVLLCLCLSVCLVATSCSQNGTDGSSASSEAKSETEVSKAESDTPSGDNTDSSITINSGGDITDSSELQHSHTYGEWETVDAPTCTKVGMKKRVCTVCNEYETEEIEKIEHELKLIEEFFPNCENDGYKDFACVYENCDYTYRENISSNGHDYKNGKCKTCSDEYYSEGLIFQLNDDGTEYSLVSQGTCTDKEVIVPSEYEGLPVTSVGINDGKSVFNAGTKKIVLPKSITYISRFSMAVCSSLEELVLPFLGERRGYVNEDTYNECYSGSYLGHYFKSTTYRGTIGESKPKGIYQYTYEYPTSGVKVYCEIPETLKTITITDTDVGAQTALFNCTSIDRVNFECSTSGFVPLDFVCEVSIVDLKAWSEGFYSHEKSVSRISNLLLDGEEIIDLVIPEGTTKIGAYAFVACKKIETITLPALSTAQISGYFDDLTTNRTPAFNGGEALKYIYAYDIPSYKSFYAKPTNVKIVLLEEYKNASLDKDYYSGYSDSTFNIYENGCYVGTETNPYSVYIKPLDKKSTSITIHRDTTTITKNALQGCKNLTELSVPFLGCCDGDGSIIDIFGYDNIATLVLQKVAITNATAISSNAFKGLSTLTEVSLCSTVESIGATAFSGTGLTAINLENVKIIEKGAFTNTYLTSINLKEATKIDENAFYGTLLTKVQLPKCLTTVYASSFGGISSLEAISVDEESTSYKSQDGVLYNYDLTEIITIPCRVKEINIPDTITKMVALTGCTELKRVTIGKSITDIYERYFDDCISLESIDVSKENTKYASNKGILFNSKKTSIVAVPKCIVEVEIPSTVTKIYKDTFAGCGKIESMVLPVVTYSDVSGDYTTKYPIGSFFGTKAFDNSAKTVQKVRKYNKRGNLAESPEEKIYYIPTSLKKIELIGLTQIDDGAFMGCAGLTSVIIPEGVTNIGEDAFYLCEGLISITIPSSVKSIENCAFDECIKLIEVCNLSSLYISEGSFSNGEIGKNALNVYTKSSGEKKTFTTDDDFVFYEGKLVGYEGNESALVLPQSYNGENYSVYKYAFYKCTEITSVTIPNSVTSIGASAFFGCTSLESISLPFVGGSNETNTFIGYIFGATSYNDNQAYVPVSLKAVTITGKSIGSYASFYGCTSLTSITIPDSVTSIGSEMFYNCTSLTSIEIPNSVTSIGYRAFRGCTNLQYNEYDNGLYIGNEGNPYLVLVDVKDANITKCNINEQTRIIGPSAFYGCNSLTSITIPEGVTSIGSEAFEHCKGLTGVTFEEGSQLTSIGSEVFYFCSSLTSVVIPNSVTSIGDNAFYFCGSLTSVVIPNSVTSIGRFAFEHCASSLTIYCEAESQPEGWQSQWNNSDYPVEWGYKKEA